jgi:hypothetical protein
LATLVIDTDGTPTSDIIYIVDHFAIDVVETDGKHMVSVNSTRTSDLCKSWKKVVSIGVADNGGNDTSGQS